MAAESIIDKALLVNVIGGTYGAIRKPSQFLCLILKLLQINPSLEILKEYIYNEDYKYIRALGCFAFRMVAPPVEIYSVLENLLTDYRKLHFRDQEGNISIVRMDEFVDNLLHFDHFCDVTLPRIPKRRVFVEKGELNPRVSPLEKEIDDLGERGLLDKEEEKRERKGSRSRSKEKSNYKQIKATMEREKMKEMERKKREENENSVEYWVQLREELGLRPFKNAE